MPSEHRERRPRFRRAETVSHAAQLSPISPARLPDAYGVADAAGDAPVDGRLRSVCEARGDGVADSFSDGAGLGGGALGDVVGVGRFGALLSLAVAVGRGVLDRVGVEVGVGVLERVGVGVGVVDGVGVGAGVSLGSGSGFVGVGLGLGVAVGGVMDGEGDGRAVVVDGLGVGVCDGLGVGVAVTVGRGLAVGVAVGLALAEADGLGDVVGPRSAIGPVGRGEVLPVRYGAGST